MATKNVLNKSTKIDKILKFQFMKDVLFREPPFLLENVSYTPLVCKNDLHVRNPWIIS